MSAKTFIDDLNALIAKHFGTSGAIQQPVPGAKAPEADIELDATPGGTVTTTAQLGRDVVLTKQVRGDDGVTRPREMQAHDDGQGSLTQALADGWVIDRVADGKPLITAPAVELEPVAEITTDLQSAMDGQGPFYSWLFGYLDTEVRGKQPIKKVKGKGSRKTERRGEVGEIAFAQLHRRAKEDGMKIGCTKPKCWGQHRDCPARAAVRSLSQQADFPVHVVGRLPFGSIYGYLPPEE